MSEVFMNVMNLTELFLFNLLVLFILCNGPEEVRIAVTVISGYGAFSTVTNYNSPEVFRNTSNRLNCV